MKQSDSDPFSSPDTLYSSYFEDQYDDKTHSAIEQADEEVKPDSHSLISLFDRHDFPLLMTGCITMLVASASKPVQAIIYGRIFEQISEFLTTDGRHKGDFVSNVGFYCGLIVVVGLVNMIFYWLGIFSWMMLGERQQDKARANVLRKVLSQRIDWFDCQVNLEGDLNQVNRSIEELRSGSSEILGLIVKNSGAIIASFVTSMYHSWNLTLVVICGSPLIGFLGWLFGTWTYKIAIDENSMSSKAAKILDWSHTSSIIVRCYNGKYTDALKFNQSVDKSSKYYFKMAHVISANVGILRCLVLLMFVQGFWYGNYLISLGKLQINQVFTCFTSCLMLGSSASELLTLMATLNKVQAAVKNYNSYVLDTKWDRLSSPNPAETVSGAIVAKGVSFSYLARDKEVLSNVCFTLRPNEMNFIVGQSGSGKSTIAKLIMGFYSPVEGMISIDGQNVSNLHPQILSKVFDYVEHDVHIFDADIESNVKLAAMNRFRSFDDVPEDTVKDAFSFAFLDQVRTSFQDDDMKPNLSGGQKQRVALARAKIKDPPILILDEPFSNLDNKTKTHIYTKLRKWRRGKTTVIITHDPNLVHVGDNVLEMEDGKVIFNGIAYKHYTSNRNSTVDARLTDLKIVDKDSVFERDHASVTLKDPIVLRNLEKSGGLNPDGIKILPISSIIKHWFVFGDTRLRIIFGTFMAMASGFTGPVFSYCFSKLLNNMVQSSVGLKENNARIKWSGIVIGVCVCDGLTHYLSQFILYCAAEKYILKVRKEIFYKINEQDMSFFTGGLFSCSTLTTSLMNDARDDRNLLSEFSLMGVSFISLSSLGIIWTIVSGWKLALVGLAFVPVILLVTGTYSKKLEYRESTYKSCVAVSESYVHDVVKGIREVHNLGIHQFMFSEYLPKLEKVSQMGLRRAIVTGFGLSLNEFCNSIAVGVILFYGIKLISSHDYSYGKFLQVSTLLSFTLASSSSLLNSIPDMSRGQRAGTLLIELSQLRNSKTESNGMAVPFTYFNSTLIRTRNLYFRHAGESDYLIKNVTLEVKTNEVVAVAGASGSGKSTLASLFVKLFEVTDNSIFVFNHDINTISSEWLRDTISLVTQSPSFFEGTIYENLVYGLKSHKISLTWTEQCLRVTNLFNFVKSLPEGLNTRMGEGSDSLFSTGQLQRLAIVRALLRRPRCLIFDESTSNLDKENIGIIANLIEQRSLICPDISIVIISHQRIMLELASKVIVLRHGEVTQEGSFASLYGSRGELYRILNHE